MASAMAIGCKSEPVDFQLDVGGSLYEATSHVSADITAHVANVDTLYFQAIPAILLTPQAAAPYKWLLENVQKPIIANVGKGGKYDVTVTGYISWHGLKFEVNEHWKSPEQVAMIINNTITQETPIAYLPKERTCVNSHNHTQSHLQRFDYVGY